MGEASCAVVWCRLPDDGHLLHRGKSRVVQGDVAAGMDSPEHEGVSIAVAIESETAVPRLGFSVIGIESSPTVRLTAEATAEVWRLLD